jgi:hypothetical protein
MIDRVENTKMIIQTKTAVEHKEGYRTKNPQRQIQMFKERILALMRGHSNE